MKHTPEPWVLKPNGVINAGEAFQYARGSGQCQIVSVTIRQRAPDDVNTSDERDANAARIVACVNACAGMDDPAAEIAGMRLDMQAHDRMREKATGYLDRGDAMSADIKSLTAQRDELLSALLALVTGASRVVGQDTCGQNMVRVRAAAIEQARAVIAKVQA